METNLSRHHESSRDCTYWDTAACMAEKRLTLPIFTNAWCLLSYVWESLLIRHFAAINVQTSDILIPPNRTAWHVGMDGYPIRLSGSGRISTIRSNPAPAGLHVARRIGFPRVTIPVIYSAWCHCAVNSPHRHENLPMKPVWCSRHVFWTSEWHDLSRSGSPPAVCR